MHSAHINNALNDRATYGCSSLGVSYRSEQGNCRIAGAKTAAFDAFGGFKGCAVIKVESSTSFNRHFVFDVFDKLLSGNLTFMKEFTTWRTSVPVAFDCPEMLPDIRMTFIGAISSHTSCSTAPRDFTLSQALERRSRESRPSPAATKKLKKHQKGFKPI
jgi:hypothetical protein